MMLECWCGECGKEMDKGYVVPIGETELEGKMVPAIEIYCYDCFDEERHVPKNVSEDVIRAVRAMMTVKLKGIGVDAL